MSTPAFVKIPNCHALLDDCDVQCDLYRGMIGNVTGKLFVATGVFYAPLTNASGNRYQDNQGRDWTAFGLAGGTE